MANTCQILYKGEYYSKQEFQTLMQDPNFAEKVRVSVLTDEFLKLWEDPSMSKSSVNDIVKILEGRGLASRNTVSEIQKIKEEVVERGSSTAKGRGAPVEVVSKGVNPPKVRTLFNNDITRGFKKFADRLNIKFFQGPLKARNKDIYESYRGINNRANYELRQVTKLNNKLNALKRKYKDLLTNTDMLNMTQVLQGAPADRLLLPNVKNQTQADAIRMEIMDIVGPMRMHIDNLTAELINSGFIKEAGVDIYLNNLGIYTTRVYEAHLNSDNWWDKLTSSPEMAHIFNTGKNFMRDGVAKRLETVKNMRQEFMKKLNDAMNQPPSKQRTMDIELYEDKIRALSSEIDKLNDLLNDEAKFEDYVRLSILGEGGLLVSPGGKKAAADLSIFKKRGEIPKEIRDLMGEVTDTGTLYAATVSKMVAFLGKYNFQLNLAMYGEGSVFSTTLDRENGFTEKLNVARMPGLRDMIRPVNDEIYVMPELKEDLASLMDTAAQSGTFMTIMNTLNGIAKMNATVLNPVTQERNFTSGSFFLLMNGYLLNRHVLTSMNVILSEIKNASVEKAGAIVGKDFDSRSELLDYLRDSALSKGVLNSNVDVQELQQLMNSGSHALLKKVKENKYGKKLTNTRLFEAGAQLTNAQLVKEIMSLPAELYEGTDNLFKLAAYMAEMNRIAPLYGYKSFTEVLNAAKSNDPAIAKAANTALVDIENKASSVIRRTIPNYGESWRINAMAKNLSFIGVFTTFLTESIRTQYNAAQITAEYLRDAYNEKDSKKKLILAKIGAERTIGFLSMLAFTVYQEQIRSILSDLFDCDPDDEDCAKKDKLKGKSKFVDVNGADTFIKYHTPPWVKTVDLRRDPDNPDGFIYSEPNSINPYSLIPTRPFERANTKFEGFYNVISPIVAPFITPEIGFSSLIQLMQGEDQNGIKFTPYEFKNEPYLWLRDMSSAVTKKTLLIPGINLYNTFYAKGEKYASRIRSNEELLQKTYDSAKRKRIEAEIKQDQKNLNGIYEAFYQGGYKNNYVDLRISSKFYTSRVAEDIKSYKETYNTRKKQTPERVDEIYEEMNTAYQKKIKDLRKLIVDTRKNLGVDVTGTVEEILRFNRFNKKELSYIKGYTNKVPDIKIPDYETRRGK